MTTETLDQRITLSDIARLAGVQRPVVSMWRSRSKDSALPFPPVCGNSKGREVFDAGEVVAWLTATGRGNNPAAVDDVGAFTFAATFQHSEAAALHGCTALLTLREVLGHPLAGMSAADLVDAADEADPDDAFLFSEIHSLERTGDLAEAAAYCDNLVHSAYSNAAAFEQLVQEKRRLNLREQAATALEQSALELLASSAIELGNPAADGTLVDPFASAGDVLRAVLHRVPEAAPVTVLTPLVDVPAVRLAHRRLRLHGALHRPLTTDPLEFPEGSVIVAQFPSEQHPAMAPAEMLSKIELLIDSMDDTHRALVVAPSSVLSAALNNRAEDRRRADILRSGRVRAAVALPRGLVRNKPRQQHTLWVLGQDHHDVPLADRWTLVADLTAHTLDDVVIQDLVGDLAAAMGSRRDVFAHSFRFGRIVLTRSLLTARGSLTGAALRPRRTASDPAEALARIDALAESLQDKELLQDDAESSLSLSAAVRSGGKELPPLLIGEAIEARSLRYFPGHRIHGEHLSGTTGVRLLGVAELLGELEDGTRRIGQLELAATYPSARRTEPGDVLFCTSPRTAAMVDEEGGAVVVFPARVLRIDDGDPGGLVPELVAHALKSAAAPDWRKRAVRRVSDAQRQPVREVLGRLEQEKSRARERLARIEELAGLVLETDGIEFTDIEASGR
ncbi:hypothetical protein SAMN04488693_101661 [Arthrobacter subterraneus]|uniref:N-6 DNA Methylase n=1 Tax=Arthrobacter subterraneus TaxID=335973 RepID=A0A1G8DN81_9MICC|nr:hypothetical protein [Arthrobacter subterraneus]SDH59102.1 hypothetical protein SAMN04488693_101661 [Arthrobacter subterraneus]